MARFHPFVEGELALAGAPVGILLGGVAPVRTSSHEEVMSFVTSQGGALRGIGWVDVHLLHSALALGLRLLTYDKALAAHHEGLTGR